MLTILWLAAAVLASPAVEAQSASSLISDSRSSRTLTVQHKCDRLFERGEFDRAYFIYRNELVPLGDKYAQYMVGYMHLTGKGVDEDPVVASAWYRLAAERGTPEFVAVRNQLMHDMEAEQHARSDVVYRQLRKEYSDMAVLLRSIKDKFRDLKPTTGSRLSTEGSPMTVIESGGLNRKVSSVDYYGRIRSQIEERLELMSELGDFPDLETDPEKVDLDMLERMVSDRLEDRMD